MLEQHHHTGDQAGDHGQQPGDAGKRHGCILAGGEAGRSPGATPSLTTMNRQELIDRVASAAELPRPAAARAVDSALSTIEASLPAGEPVRLTGFGKFHVAHSTGRPGVNPRTGERIEVATTAVPRFTAGVRLKQAVRGAPRSRSASATRGPRPRPRSG